MPQAFTLSFNVPTRSLERNLESVRGFVRTLCCSYNFCMIDKVSLAEAIIRANKAGPPAYGDTPDGNKWIRSGFQWARNAGWY